MGLDGIGMLDGLAVEGWAVGAMEGLEEGLAVS